MIPGNVDPRRAEKVQRYKPPQANGNAPVEDLTPDYMNILGPDSATANADGLEKSTSADHQQPPGEDAANGSNVIPTSPQYGVAIITSVADAPSEIITPATDSVVETTTKTSLTAGDEVKDMHSTPSRNDRFKVVKIASLEPFRRGRWKCMDYVDENPPQTTQQQSKQTQSATNIQQMSSLQYMQTQSLPQQHFQQMLVQGAFSGSPQGFYQNVPNPMMPQSQYFYNPQQGTVNLQQVPVQGNSIQPTFINTSQQYFPANMPPHSGAGYTTYSNVQYVPSNLIQTQSSAFVPTSQAMANNFQQSQTYAGQSSQPTQQPLVNGHAFPTSTEQPQVSSLPTQIAKNVIMQPAIVSTNQGLVNQSVAQNSINPNQQPHQYNPSSYNPNPSIPNQSPQGASTNITQVTQGTPSTIITSGVPIQLPPSNPASGNQITITQMQIPGASMTSLPNSMPGYDLSMPMTNAVYTNPQFMASESNSNDGQGDGSMSSVGEAGNNENQENPTGEDPAKTNPVVNAIDNKIEQAMDLVKSHLMYTVREEVEVLKEKIVELMERIQQLETENAYLKQQISKGVTGQVALPASTTNGSTSNGGGTPDPAQSQPQQQPPQQQQ